MVLRWTTEAAEDLERITDYLFDHKPEHAARLVRALYDAPATLLTFPNRGRPGKKEGTRELGMSPLPYIVVYTVHGDAVHVVRYGQSRPDAVAGLAGGLSRRNQFPPSEWTCGSLRSANEPCPIGRVLLDEVAREWAVAASAAPDLRSAAGKFRRAVLCIFEEFKAAMLRAIEPQGDALADFKRLVLMSKLYPPFKVVEVRRHHLLDHVPSRFRGLDVPARARPRIQVVQVERL